MSTDDTEKALAYIREAYVRPPGIFGHYGAEGRGREFDALIARVRRDAKAEAWDGACEAFAWCIANGPIEDALPYVAEHNPHRETGDRA